MLRKTSPNFCFPEYIADDGKPRTAAASNFPTVYWPNGRWCLEVNMFLINLKEAGASTLVDGGTPGTYARQLIHLSRFCAGKGIRFIELTDKDFSHFMYALTEPLLNQNLASPRTARTVRNIGRTCLTFLEYVGQIYGRENFVSEHGQIWAFQHSSSKRRKFQANKQWSHRSFPKASPERQAGLIDKQTILALHDAVPKISDSDFIQKRRLAMLYLLEQTGCRRTELTLLKSGTVLSAIRENATMLSIPTIKRGGLVVDSRKVPVTQGLLSFLEDYIEFDRGNVIRRTCGCNGDDGSLLISSRTGKGLVSKSVSLELSKLKRAAGIKGKVGAHSFRHRFITEIYKKLAGSNLRGNGGLTSSTTILLILQQYAGHRSAESLRRYVHLAESDINSKIINS